MRKLNAQQEEVLKSFATQLYLVGFVDDADLLFSTCGCCKEKRKLYKKIVKAMDKAAR